MDYATVYKDYPDVVTVKEVQKMLRIGRNSAYKLISNGSIETVRVGKRHIIPKANVIRYLLDSLENGSVQEDKNVV